MIASSLTPLSHGLGPVQIQSSLKALILDDSTFDRRRICRMCRDTGMVIQVEEVASLASLEKALEETDFDIILVDYNLPEGDGIEAIEMVSNHAQNGDCPTVMVAGDAQASIAVQAMRLGCADYISKEGLTAQKLRESILNAIESANVKPFDLSDAKERTNAIFEAVSGQYSKLMQPELARLLRDLRALKSALNNPRTNIPNDLEKIEKRCLGVWELLRAPVSGTTEKSGSKSHLWKMTKPGC